MGKLRLLLLLLLLLLTVMLLLLLLHVLRTAPRSEQSQALHDALRLLQRTPGHGGQCAAVPERLCQNTLVNDKKGPSRLTWRKSIAWEKQAADMCSF